MFEAHAGVGGAGLPVDALWGRVAVLCPRGALNGGGACRVRTINSGSALLSQLPCRGVNARCTRRVKRRAASAETPGRTRRRYECSDGRRPGSGARPGSRADDPRGLAPGAPSPRPCATSPAAPRTARGCRCRAARMRRVVGGGTARARRLRRPLVGPQQFGLLVPADHRIAHIVRLAVKVQHRFHRNPEVRLRHRRIAPLPPTPICAPSFTLRHSQL